MKRALRATAPAHAVNALTPKNPRISIPVNTGEASNASTS